VGQAVRSAEARAVQLGGLDEAELGALHPAFREPEVKAALDPAQAVERRKLLGGPARERVLEAIDEARRFWALSD
jgi:argininosuccinate lyase